MYIDFTPTIEISYCPFTDNMVDEWGGGALSTGDDFQGELDISYSPFTGNKAFSAAQGGGGAISIAGVGMVRISHCPFVENIATNTQGSIVGGGAISIGGGAVGISHCPFARNRANAGGAVEVHQDSRGKLDISYCPFTDNTADRGNHIYARGVQHFYVYGTTFEPYASGVVSVALDALGGCAEFPCAPGQRCSYIKHSLFCEPCGAGLVGENGLTCDLCDPGSGPSASLWARSSPSSPSSDINYGGTDHVLTKLDQAWCGYPDICLHNVLRRQIIRTSVASSTTRTTFVISLSKRQGSLLQIGRRPWISALANVLATSIWRCSGYQNASVGTRMAAKAHFRLL
jgi:hypothetical protein